MQREPLKLWAHTLLGASILIAAGAGTATAAPLDAGTGKMTWYNDAGNGACGTALNASTEMLVAVPSAYWTAGNPNEDALCGGMQVEVSYEGRTITVPVKDRCPSCEPNHIDLSLPAFSALAAPDRGAVSGISWRFVDKNGTPVDAPAEAMTAAGVTPSRPASDVTSEIVGLADKCVDVDHSKTKDGTRIQLYECNGTGAQKWTFATDGSIKAFGKCLDVDHSGTRNGTRVQLWECNHTGAQQWVVTDAGDIVNPQADKCLDVTDRRSEDETPLQIWTCHGGSNQKWKHSVPMTSRETVMAQPLDHADGHATGDEYQSRQGSAQGGFVVSEQQFNEMFPNRNSFYSYQGLVVALGAYPQFAHTGDEAQRKREAAAFLANVSHETGGLVHVVEQNTANYGSYCDPNQPYGCPAGQSAYHGRGPIQLSWNTNYKAAGDALGADLLNHPDLVEKDAGLAWATALWFWNTQNGAGSTTAHNAMVNGSRFGETIRTINGALECGGANPATVQSRVATYQHFAQILGISVNAQGC